MLLEDLVPVLKARWLRVALTFVVIAAAVLAVSAALPPRYEATAAVAIELPGVDPITRQVVFKPSGAVSTHIATQVDIMRSEEVALRALRRLGLHEQPGWRELWRSSTDGQGEFEAWLAARLLRDLDVRPARDSNVVNLSYTSPDPQFAAAVANAFVESFVDLTLDMQVGPARQFNTFFEENAKVLRDALEQARARLSEYEKEHGLAVGEPDVESARLAELTSQLVALQDQAAEAANLRRQASAAPADLRDVRNDPEVAALTSELVRLEGHLAELKSEFGEQHHAVIEARQSIRDVKRRMDAAMRRAAEGLAAPARVIEARLAKVQAAIERQRALVLKRKAERDGAASLVREVENAEQAYGAVLARASQTALESANTTAASVSTLKSASVPLWSPMFIIRNTLVAAVVGLLLGIAWAWLAESRDRRVRTVAHITGRLQQPLLLMLPDGASRRTRRLEAEQTRRRLVAVQRRLPALR